MTKKTKEDFLVKGLEAVEPAYAEFQGNMYAGMLPVLEPQKHDDRVIMKGETMFWLFEPNTQSAEKTLVIWLNGGPGCSSFNCGVLMEHSPVTQPLHDAGYCCLEATPKMFYNEKYAWTQATTMLYVEHPLGTGWSFGVNGYEPQTELEASQDLYNFLQHAFFDVFEHLREYEFFVIGESYAGMFVPSVAWYINEENKKLIAEGAPKEQLIKLGGAALGNGWIDATIQGPATVDYSWWHGMIDAPTRKALLLEWQNCLDNYYAKFVDGKSKDAGNFQPPFHPFNVQDDCGIMWGILQASGNNNAYDVTTWDPNVDQVTFTSEAFYNRLDVKAALHAPANITWHGCRPGGGRRKLFSTHVDYERANHNQRHAEGRRQLYMDNDRPLSVAPFIADLLNSDIPVLVYNGDRDMTTCMVGTELVLNQMTGWKDHGKWLDAPRGLWMDSADTSKHPEAGWAKEYGKLQFVVVYNSGHMVPYNRPSPALDLLKRFLNHKTFLDQELPQIRASKHLESKYGRNDMEAWMKDAPHPVQPNDKMAGMYSKHAKYSESSLLSGADVGGLHNATALVALVSFLVGAVVSLMVVKLQSRRHRQRKGYQSVPNTMEIE